MIEYNFGELDNDFITCWCKYLLTGDIKTVIKDIEKLAELGQINAIMEWYKFKGLGDNPTIDKHTEELSDTYNDLFIKARIGSKDTEQIKEYNDLLNYVDEEVWVNGIRSGYYDLTDKAIKARGKIKELEYINNYYLAVQRAFQIGNRTNDLIVMETANEMYSELARKIGIKDYAKKINKRVKKNNSYIIKSLIKTMDKEEKENSQYNPLNKPIMCFQLSKAILLFNENHKRKPLAIHFLKELSQREYSLEFKQSKPIKRY